VQVPFHKPYLTEKDITNVIEVLKSGWTTMGPKTIEFETQFGEYIGAGKTITMNSCTACLHLALLVLGVGPGDEVIVPTNTFTSTAEVVTYLDAKPVLVDVNRDTQNMDVEDFERSITAKTKAVIPVHFAGQPCDMNEILSIAREHNLKVIEDAAHALPSWYKGCRIGTLGDITCFSFYATKTLAMGEGGAATTENDAWAERMKILRLHGISKDAWKRYSRSGSWYYEVVEAGYKYNMTDIQAALGLAQLEKIDWMNERRNSIAERYTQNFRDLKEITVPVINSDRSSAWHLYVIKLNLETLRLDRSAFIESLKEKWIGTSVHFIPLHRHPYYRKAFNYTSHCFPNSEWNYQRVVSLPIFPGMTDIKVDYVIENVIELCKRSRR